MTSVCQWPDTMWPDSMWILGEWPCVYFIPIGEGCFLNIALNLIGGVTQTLDLISSQSSNLNLVNSLTGSIDLISNPNINVNLIGVYNIELNLCFDGEGNCTCQ